MWILKLHTRQQPFPEISKDVQVIAAILSGKRQQIPSCTTEYQRFLFKLVEYCLEEDISDRPDAQFVASSLEGTHTELDYEIIFLPNTQPRPFVFNTQMPPNSQGSAEYRSRSHSPRFSPTPT